MVEHLKHLKTGSVPCLGLELTIHDIKSRIHLVRHFKRIWICDLRVEITAFFLSSRPRKESKCPVLWLVVSSAFPQIRPIGMNHGENKTNILEKDDLGGGAEGAIFLIFVLRFSC